MSNLKVGLHLSMDETVILANSLKPYLYGEEAKKIKRNVEKELSIVFNDRLNKLEERIRSLEKVI